MESFLFFKLELQAELRQVQQTEVTVISVQNGDHWHRYTFRTDELRSDSQIAVFEVIQQHMLR
jgi:sulfur carrier protein ThiS